MKAIILSAEKKTLPIQDPETLKDVDVVMVEVKVQFQKEDGTPYFTQTYALAPQSFDENNPSEYFDIQAQAMQNELDLALKNVVVNSDNVKADAVVEQLTTDQPEDVSTSEGETVELLNETTDQVLN